MNQFELAQAFIEQCRAEVPVRVLAEAFQRSTEALGFRYFACCSHVDPLKPPRRAVMLHSYPHEWVQLYSELNFVEIDPVFIRASRSLVPFFWNTQSFGSELTPAQRAMFREARRFGVTRGFTVPIHSVSSPREFPASCSVIPGSDALASEAYSAVQLMSFYMYEAASKEAEAQDPPSTQQLLSRRERQCLELAAQGKSDWATSKILGLSERTVHNHVESAKRRLRVATRMQAVVHALAGQQISLGDVVRNDSRSAAADEQARSSREAVRSRSKVAMS